MSESGGPWNDEIDHPSLRLCDMTEGERAGLCMAAWEHRYNCDCRLCQGAWAVMGPDGFVKGNWGPFTEDDMRQFCEEEGVPFIEGE